MLNGRGSGAAARPRKNARYGPTCSPPRAVFRILNVLIEFGADLEAEDKSAEDKSGQTALAVAMLRGDREAMRGLHAAGAKQPKTIAPPSFKASMAKMRRLAS